MTLLHTVQPFISSVYVFFKFSQEREQAEALAKFESEEQARLKRNERGIKKKCIS